MACRRGNQKKYNEKHKKLESIYDKHLTRQTKHIATLDAVDMF